MISPAQQTIIQVDITNACPHQCSNCTRFCGHHKKPYMMDMPTFKQAINSLVSFPGMVGIMGGEPTLHPDFQEMVDYYRSRITDNPAPEMQKHVGLPLPSFKDFRSQYKGALYDTRQGIPFSSRRGLWTSLGPNFNKHYETIMDTFGYMCVNEHKNNGRHMPLLVNYKDLGFTREEFLQYRDDCWLQKFWSASITPKGAFFCEVAGALDMLFDGPGGWPVEPGWWLRCPQHFGDQLKWCDICSACLPLTADLAIEETDTVSPSVLKMLEDIGSPKIAKGKYRLVTPDYVDKDRPQTCTPYIENEASRADDIPEGLATGGITVIIACDGLYDTLDITLPLLKHTFNRPGDRVIVATGIADEDTPYVCDRYGAECVKADSKELLTDTFNKGRLMNKALEQLKPKGWVLFTDCDIVIPKSVREALDTVILNKGCIYYTARHRVNDVKTLGPFHEQFQTPCATEALKVPVPTLDLKPHGYFQLFHTDARALDWCGDKLLAEARGSAEGLDWEFAARWPEHKQFLLPTVVLHLEHGVYGSRWHGLDTTGLYTQRTQKMMNPFLSFVKTMGTGLVGVELGMYIGELTTMLWNTGAFRSLYGVDLWEGGYDPGDLASQTDMKKAESVARKRVEGISGIHLLKMSTLDASNELGKVDFVYVDANHTEEAVLEDITAWVPNIKKGGWLAGHDYGRPNHPGVKTVVDRLFGAPDLQFQDTSWAVQITEDVMERLGY